MPDIEYSYDVIVNGPVRILPAPSVYEEDFLQKGEAWEAAIQSELKKIKPALGEDATEEEIEDLFKKMLYIAQYDYTPIETVERFGYVIFKDDMINPMTNQKIG